MSGSVIDTMLSLVTGPAVEPLDLDEVKKARRFSSTTLDTLFDLWISAARHHFEEQTGRQLITATWELWMDAFPAQAEIELPRPPLQSVLGVFYLDGAGDEQEVDADSYRVVAPSGPYAAPGRIVLNSGASWPIVGAASKAVRIRFTAGYGDAPGDVSELAKGALHMLIGHFHRYSEETTEKALSVLPIGATKIIEAFKYTALPTLQPRRAA